VGPNINLILNYCPFWVDPKTYLRWKVALFSISCWKRREFSFLFLANRQKITSAEFGNSFGSFAKIHSMRTQEHNNWELFFWGKSFVLHLGNFKGLKLSFQPRLVT